MSIETPPPKRGVTPSQEGAIKVIPKPKDVAVEAPEVEAPIVTPPGVNRRRFLAGLGGVAAGAAIEAHPATKAMVNLLMERLLAAIGLREPFVPDSFNNNDQSGMIGDKNTISLPLSEIQQRFPKEIVAEGDTTTFLFPFQPPEKGKIEYQRSLGLIQLTDPKFVPEQDRQKQEQAVKEQQEIRRRGVQNQLDFLLPKGTIMIAPIKGHILVEAGRQEWGENPNNATGAIVIFYDQSVNTTSVLKFFRMDKGSDFEPLVALQQPGGWSGTDWQKIPVEEQGQPLLKSTKDNQPMRLSLEAYKGQVIGPYAATVTKSLFLLTPQFATAQDDDGKEKLLVMKD